MSETQGISLSGSSWWSRTAFYLSGFLVCAFRGKLDRYSYLLAQAYVENRDDLSGRCFVAYGSPWCMHEGSTTRRASEYIPGDGAALAKYTNSITGNRFAKAWHDRLDWDQAHNPDADTSSCETYLDAINADVGSNNWSWRGYNVPQDKKDSYKAAVLQKYRDVVGPIPKAFDGKPLVPSWVVAILVAGIIATLVFLIYKQVRKWSRSGS